MSGENRIRLQTPLLYLSASAVSLFATFSLQMYVFQLNLFSLFGDTKVFYN